MHKEQVQYKMFKGLKWFFISPFLFSLLFCGHPISIDGLFSDWDNVALAYQDIENDNIDADRPTKPGTNAGWTGQSERGVFGALGSISGGEVNSSK